MRGVFARNPDGSLKHAKPCQTLDCDSPNWHLCIKANKKDRFPELLARPQRRASELSDSHRESIAQSQRERWDRIRLQNKPRDDKIIEMYNDGGIGTVALAKEFGLGRDRILKILRAAAEEGRTTIRKRGQTVANGF